VPFSLSFVDNDPSPSSDEELAPNGKLWNYLKHVAMFSGGLQEYVELHGGYNNS
jgi:hypothetical protein